MVASSSVAGPIVPSVPNSEVHGLSESRRSTGALRLGVVGCGTVFERLHLPVIRESGDWKLAGLSEIDDQRRTWLERTLPEVPVHESVEDLLGVRELDGVMILTPAQSHAPLAELALERGIATFIEKPMATDVESALEIAGAVARHGAPVQVGFNRRMRQTYQDLREEIASRGRPRRLSYHFLSDGRRWRSSWSRPEDEALHEVAVHGIDLLPWLLGSRVLRVKARSEDGGMLRLEIETDVNVPGTIRAGVSDRYMERLVAEWTGRSVVAHPGGVLGGFWVPEFLPRAVERAHALTTAVLRRLRGRPGLTEESLRRQLRALAGRVRGEDASGAADAADGLRAVRAVDAVRRSLAKNGAWIELEAVEENPDPRGAS